MHPNPFRRSVLCWHSDSQNARMLRKPLQPNFSDDLHKSELSGHCDFTFPVVILARILSIIPTTNCQKSSMHSIIKRFGAQ